MHLFLIRHGQSTNNADTSLSSRVADPALTATGEHQAQQLADYISTHPEHFGITHLYASPMLRALQTATPLAQALQLPLQVWPDICEYGGIYLDDEGSPHGIAQSGLTRPQIMERFPLAELDDTITDEGWWKMPNGHEPFENVLMRVIRVATALKARADTSDRVALVSHGLFIDLMIKALLNQLPNDFGSLFYMQYNTGINYFQLREARHKYHNEVTVNYLNSRPHLTREWWTD